MQALKDHSEEEINPATLTEQEFQKQKEDRINSMIDSLSADDTVTDEEAVDHLITLMKAMDMAPEDLAIESKVEVMQERFNRLMDLTQAMGVVSNFDMNVIINWSEAQATFELSNDVHFSVCKHLGSAAGKSEAAGAFGGFAWFIASKAWAEERNVDRQEWLKTLCILLEMVSALNEQHRMQALQAAQEAALDPSRH